MLFWEDKSITVLFFCAILFINSLFSKKDALSTLQSVAKYLKLSGEKVSLIGCTAKWGEY